MSIKQLQVRNFQSLWSVDLDLGKLTVVVGPSNTGKSALGRALRAVSRNSVAPGHVSKGASNAGLVLVFDDDSAVILKRGKGESTYITLSKHGKQETYAKSGTSVPDDVKKMLQMPEGDPDLFFSTQFDGPWLLGATGSQTAKVLGDLTNVSMLAEAAREANRRRQEVLKLASIRRKDAEAAVVRVQAEYSDLGSRKQAVDQAADLLKSVIDVAAQATQLRELANRTITAQEVVARGNQEATRLGTIITQAKDQIEALTVKEAEADRLRQCADEAIKHAFVLRTAKGSALLEADAIAKYEHELHEALKEAGTCPLCQQKIA